MLSHCSLLSYFHVKIHLRCSVQSNFCVVFSKHFPMLQVLSLDWSSGIERVKCIARVDISLHGSFANMTVIPRPGGMENTPAAGIFILTNPGQLHIYDISSLSESRPQDCKPEVNAVKFPLTIPTTDPSMTVTKFYFLPTDGDLKKALSKVLLENFMCTNVSFLIDLFHAERLY